jgi:excisionase family DNA binding protein
MAVSAPAERHDKNAGQAGNDDRLLTADQVAELLAVPESWVREATRAGRLPYIALGRYRRYSRHEIQAWLQELGQGTRPQSRQTRSDLHHGGCSSL